MTTRIDRIIPQSGFSLIELLVALVISTFLLAGVVQVFVGSKKTYTLNQGVARLQENVRFAFDRMSSDLSAAGFMGCNDSGDRDVEGNLVLVNALTNATATQFNFANPIDGVENGGLNGSDILSVRRALTASAVPLTDGMDEKYSDILLDSGNANYDTLEQWDVIALSDCATTSVFMITNDPASSGGVIEHATGIVAPTSSANAGQSNAVTTIAGVDYNDLKVNYGSDAASTATLTRVATRTYSIRASDFGTGTSLFLNEQELVEGVEDMQVLYGLDNDGVPGVEQYVAADDPALVAAGVNMVGAVRVSLTLNTVSDIQVEGTSLTKVVTQTIRLRNR